MRCITKAMLEQQLGAKGHNVVKDRSSMYNLLRIWPRPHEIVTVAVEIDSSLKRQYRHRYYVCAADQQDNAVIERDSRFAFPGFFARIAAEAPLSGTLMYGPLRWLLPRLTRFNQVLFWPERGFQGSDGCGFLNYLLPDGPRIDEAPCIKQWLLESVDQPDAVGAAVLDLSIPLDCNVVWEAADLVARLSYNMYFGDGAAREVYLVHHHDKVVISIPDKRGRDNLISELSDDKMIFVDRSDY